MCGKGFRKIWVGLGDIVKKVMSFYFYFLSFVIMCVKI